MFKEYILISLAGTSPSRDLSDWHINYILNVHVAIMHIPKSTLEKYILINNFIIMCISIVENGNSKIDRLKSTY